MSSRSAGLAVALAAAVAIAIGVLSFTSDRAGKPRFRGEDKVKHALAYGVLAWTGARAASRLGAGPRGAAAAAIGAAAAYGAAIEALQPYFGRSGEIADEVANIAGALLGGTGWLGLARAAPPGLAASLASLAIALVAPGCATAPAALPSAEERIREQAALRRSRDADLVQDVYAVIEASVPAGEKPFYKWLRVRLEPDRAPRKAGIEEVVAAAPRLVPALLEAGDLAFEEGDRATARDRWTAALDAAPGSPRALARVAWLDRSPERARAAIDAARKEAHPLPEGFLAGAWLTLGEPAEARKVLDAARAEGLEDPITWMFGGLERLASGDPVEASRRFERALLRTPRDLVPLEDYLRATLSRIEALVASGLDLEARELATIAAGRWPGVEPFRRAAERRRTWRLP